MYKKPLIQPLVEQSFASQHISVDVLRLDLIHPLFGGNKPYKLKYYLERAITEGRKGLLSFGGAYSNHLVAMAFACHEKGLRSVGVIRGERPSVIGPSLLDMEQLGMELFFVSRESYRLKALPDDIDVQDLLIVPEGGAGEEGVRGASEILDEVNNGYSHIFCAVGTGTTLAGLANKSSAQVIGISSLKISGLSSIASMTDKANWKLVTNYHFGGYAKRTEKLTKFMEDFYQRHNIPTDFVYTGKMFFALYDMIAKRQLTAASKVLAIHTGGLQGNRGLMSL